MRGRYPTPRGRTGTKPRHGMNRTEERYAAHLARQVAAGQLAGFWFESVKVRLADRTWYAPDFLVQLPDGWLELHEVKGFMEGDAAVKLKVVCEIYWAFPLRLVREVRGAWQVTDVAEGLG